MNRSQLIKRLIENHNIEPDKAELVTRVFFDLIHEAILNNERVEIRGFGSFKVKKYKSYIGRNPLTGEKVKVKEKRLPLFKMGKELKKRLNSKD